MKKILLSITIILGLLILTGCDKDYEGNITSFTYNYGSYNPGFYECRITTNENKPRIEILGFNGLDINVKKDITKKDITKLQKIINENKIYKWNGFEERNDKILDGNGFKLIVEYDDGKTINATGYMKYPKDYDKGHKALIEFLDKYIEKTGEEKNEE